MAAENSVTVEPRQRRRVVLGALIISGLVAGAVLIFFLDDLRKSLREEYAIYAVIAGAPGLAEGSPVWVSGRAVGTVTSVGLLPAGADSLERVVLRLELPVDAQPHVRRDSQVRLTSVNLMSERVVDITPGTAAAPALAPGDTLAQVIQPTPMQLTARAAAVRAQMDAALADLRTHAPAIRARLVQTDRALNGLAAAVEQARALQADLDANPGYALLQDPAFTTSLDNVRAHAAELPVLISRLRDRTGPTSELRSALARLQLRADSLRVQLAVAAAALENPNGTFARMQQDSALTRAIAAARAELDSLLADVRRNPLRFVF